MKVLALVLVVGLLLCGCEIRIPEETVGTAPGSTEPPAVFKIPSSPYQPEDFVQTEGFLECTKGNTVVGIDVSSYQETIDWEKVAASGVKFAIIRLGYRGYETGTLHEDEFAKQNLEGAKAAGLKVGAYFFSQAVSEQEAKTEASYALEILNGFVLDLPVVFDWEFVSDSARTGQVDRDTLTEATKAFCAEIERSGYRAMVYFNTSQAMFKLDLKELGAYPWWLAKYDLDMVFYCQVDLWQYTDQGSIPGIQGDVDIDLMFTDYGLGKELFGT